jgi:radical SAM superfamily enzyme YgiQ (UPF0313 family)
VVRKRLKLWLINPRLRDERGRLPANGVPVNALMNHPLAMPLLAARTPDHYDIRLLDEVDGRLDFAALSGPVDLVGLTVLTPAAPRAYELATFIRRQGVKVVLGGPHASALPQEAQRYADSVVTGEADWVWPKVLEDFENGRLQPLYQGEARPVEGLPVPRWDLFEKKTFVKQVETARCRPIDWERGGTVSGPEPARYRPIDEVVAEIEALGDKTLSLMDDNIAGRNETDRRRAVALFKALRPLNRKFDVAGSSLELAESDELLRSASSAGLQAVEIKYVSEESIRRLDPRLEWPTGSRIFRQKIRRIQEAGIGVMVSFVFGGDAEAPDTFKRVAELVHESGMMANLTLAMTPLPGTPLYRRLAGEGRLLYTNYPGDWARYGQLDLVFRPKGMTNQEFRAGLDYLQRETAGLRPAIRRGFDLAARSHDLKLGLRCTVFNAMPWSKLEGLATHIR